MYSSRHFEHRGHADFPPTSLVAPPGLSSPHSDLPERKKWALCHSLFLRQPLGITVQK